jgi:hypothetical protein
MEKRSVGFVELRLRHGWRMREGLSEIDDEGICKSTPQRSTVDFSRQW